jgi:hypothetical protein
MNFEINVARPKSAIRAGPASPMRMFDWAGVGTIVRKVNYREHNPLRLRPLATSDTWK